MKSITIHKIDTDLEKRLDEMASRTGLSLNQLIKNLLRERMGLDKLEIDNRADFEEFCGSWTKEDVDEFEEAVAGCSEIDEDMWK